MAKHERDWDRERKILGVTLRYVSLMVVSFGTILMLLAVTATVETLGTPATALKVISLISLFSVIGAATADNLI